MLAGFGCLVSVLVAHSCISQVCEQWIATHSTCAPVVSPCTCRTVLHSLPLDEKRCFLQFATGCDRAPVAGLKALRLVVQVSRWKGSGGVGAVLSAKGGVSDKACATAAVWCRSWCVHATQSAINCSLGRTTALQLTACNTRGNTGCNTRGKGFTGCKGW
jgi:hypothetical protein